MLKHNLPYRRSIRLKDWEYSNPGLYFITICTKNRQNQFGEIHDGIMGLTIPGCLAYYLWTQIPKYFPNVILDECIVMPNHVHGIIGLTGRDAIHGVRGVSDARPVDHNSDAMNRIPTNPEQTTNTPKTVGSPIYRDRNHLNQKDKTQGGLTQHHNPMLYKNHLGKIIRWYKGRCSFEIRKRQYYDFAWQSRYYDHIIRNEKELDHIREYIFNNPLKWQFDNENPDQIHEIEIRYLVNQ